MEHYLALFEPDLEAGGYTVTFPDFGYGVTQGETAEEATEMAQDLLILTIGDYVREGKQLPVPTRHPGAKFRPIPLPALQSAKVDLYTAFLESGTKKAEFARRIGIPKTHIERLFSLRHHSRLNQIEAALAVLGKRLHVEACSVAKNHLINHSIIDSLTKKRYDSTMTTSNHVLKHELTETETVQRLLANKNWRGAAKAAIEFYVDGKPCQIPSWPKSSTWAQVKMAFDEVKQRKGQPA